jgi:hypothetical protein
MEWRVGVSYFIMNVSKCGCGVVTKFEFASAYVLKMEVAGIHRKYLPWEI